MKYLIVLSLFVGCLSDYKCIDGVAYLRNGDVWIESGAYKGKKCVDKTLNKEDNREETKEETKEPTYIWFID